jgi:hypothetical protein
MRKLRKSTSPSRNRQNSLRLMKMLRLHLLVAAECRSKHSPNLFVSLFPPLTLSLDFSPLSAFIEKARNVKSGPAISERSEDDDTPPTTSPPTQSRQASKFGLVANYQPNNSSLLTQKENIFTVGIHRLSCS